VVLAALLGGGSFVFGLISPKASTAWRASGSLIVEKETGSRFVMLNGQLRPTLNYASAMLVAGQKAAPQFVSRADLAGVPVGKPIGIPGAPDELPTASALAPGTWSVCLRFDGSAVLSLSPGAQTGRALNSGDRILVASTDPAQPAEFVVFNAVKYPLPQPGILSALGLGDQQPIPAAPGWLAVLPTGEPVTPAAIPGAGAKAAPVGGVPARVGTLFASNAGGAQQYYVLLSDGLAPITHTEAALFSVGGAAPPQVVSPAVIAATPVSANHTLLNRLPNLLDGAVFAGAPCVVQSSPGHAAQTSVVADLDPQTGTEPAVVVPPRGGMLVQPPGGTPESPAPDYLITDTGKKYLISGGDALNALGYGSATANVMPPSVLALIPSGPVLDVATAQRGSTT
jgi:type VII secretion protein EccB